jgi:8-oxo-dGTP pyrophosphatase MutT (NUDIX family)
LADTWSLPAGYAEHAERFFAEGGPPAAPRVAATVALLRPASGAGLEVYVIRRAATMAFASQMYAFPGGGVDPADADGALAARGVAGASRLTNSDASGWTGPSPQEWASRLDLPEGAAQAVVCAAVREVFEEAGVLLAGADPGTLVDDVSGGPWESVRRALVAREHSLTEALAARRLLVRSDLLAPWTRWITPDFEPRRFDTYFFIARLPEGQRTRDVSGEADHTEWVRPAVALDRYAAGEMAMLPPTAVLLRDLAGYDTVDSALAAAADRDAATPIQPHLERGPDGAPRLVIP